jgi:hypothetical protein
LNSSSVKYLACDGDGVARGVDAAWLSSGWNPDAIGAPGLFSEPPFAAWNQVWLHDCSGDGLTGTRTDQYWEEDDVFAFGAWRQGRVGLEELVTRLEAGVELVDGTRLPRLGSASAVLLAASGELGRTYPATSGQVGGVGAADWIRERLGGGVQTLLVVEGVGPDRLENPRTARQWWCYGDELRADWVELAQAAADASCLEFAAEGGSPLCGCWEEPHALRNHVTTPFFAVADVLGFSQDYPPNPDWIAAQQEALDALDHLAQPGGAVEWAAMTRKPAVAATRCAQPVDLFGPGGVKPLEALGGASVASLLAAWVDGVGPFVVPPAPGVLEPDVDCPGAAL